MLEPAQFEEVVIATFQVCLFQDGENRTQGVLIEGVTRSVLFHSDRLKTYHSVIVSLLGQLSDGFRVSKWGGASFLAAHYDRHGRMWTNNQYVVDQLVMLGLAIGMVEFNSPRETWSDSLENAPFFKVKL